MISDKKRSAAKLILLNYANDDDASVHEAIEAIATILGCNNEITLRDQFAMATMTGDWAAQRPEWHSFSRSSAQEAFDRNAELYYRMADSMLKTRML